MSWWLPPAASTFARDIDFMFTLILVITGIALVIVELGLIWFVIQYRARPGRRAFYTHGSAKAEVVWSAVPAVTVVILGIMSNGMWTKIKGRDSVPPGAYPIGVHAKQFEWQITYPGPDGQLETGDDFAVRNQLHLPVGRPVVTHLTAEDVIHAFWVPEFRVKQDAVPGMNINVWFQPTTVDSLEMGCAELCGMGHYRMRARVWVWPADQYDACAKQSSQEFLDCLRPAQAVGVTTGRTGS
jgi:cytochrome c oxidase subunit II